MSIYLLLTYLLSGLLSGAHCAGMCGGMISGISFGLRGHNNKRVIWTGLSLGRLSGYAVGGAIAGGLGWLLLSAGHAFLPLQQGLALVAGLMLILMGISIAGWPVAIRWTEGPGRRLWKILQPIWSSYLPPKQLKAALIVGLFWGWLPCGLIYSVWINALASTSPMQGALIMLAFGLGTLPNVLAVAWLSGRLRLILQHIGFRSIAGLLIILAGVQQIYRAVAPSLS